MPATVPPDQPPAAPAPADPALARDAAAPPPRPERYPRSWGALLAALAGRALLDPRLAIDLIRTAWAFRRRDWYSHAPFLPLPDPTYLRWRMYTAYADEHAIPPAEHVIRFARWRRETMGF